MLGIVTSQVEPLYQVLARALYGDIAGLLATLQVLRAPQLEAGHAALLELVPGGQLVQSVLQQHL